MREGRTHSAGTMKWSVALSELMVLCCLDQLLPAALVRSVGCTGDSKSMKRCPPCILANHADQLK
jgi:hypothetical protein